MSSPLEEFSNNELSGPYATNRIPELIEKVAAFIGACSLTERGKAVRLGQLTSKLLKCQATSWAGLSQVETEFSRVEIFIDRSGEVLNVHPMIIDNNGECFDLEEASGKIDWMIPKSEIIRRCESYRDNSEY